VPKLHLNAKFKLVFHNPLQPKKKKTWEMHHPHRRTVAKVHGNVAVYPTHRMSEGNQRIELSACVYFFPAKWQFRFLATNECHYGYEEHL